MASILFTNVPGFPHSGWSRTTTCEFCGAAGDTVLLSNPAWFYPVAFCPACAVRMTQVHDTRVRWSRSRKGNAWAQIGDYFVVVHTRNDGYCLVVNNKFGRMRWDTEAEAMAYAETSFNRRRLPASRRSAPTSRRPAAADEYG